MIYRVMSPVAGKAPMLCGLGEYPGQEFTSRLNVALGVFEACAARTHVVLQELSRESGAWVDVDVKAMLAAREQARADANRVIGLRAQIEQLQDELAEAEQKAGASKRAAAAEIGRAM